MEYKGDSTCRAVAGGRLGWAGHGFHKRTGGRVAPSVFRGAYRDHASRVLRPRWSRYGGRTPPTRPPVQYLAGPNRIAVKWTQCFGARGAVVSADDS